MTVHAAAQAQASVELDRAFKLGAQRSAAIAAERLEIGFERVVSDSRCPEDAQCIAAGDAVVRVWLRKAPAARETRDLKTRPDAGSAVYGTYRVTLVKLDPVLPLPAPSAPRITSPPSSSPAREPARDA